MPRKIREILAELTRAGFVQKSGKGSHRKFTHPTGVVIIVAGAAGDDAKIYQEKDLRKALEQLRD